MKLKPRLSEMHSDLRQMNYDIFAPFLFFSKPIFAAVNGSSVGGATTFQLLCDAVLCAPSATFHTPFKQLGITPEGCSTVTFQRKMGNEGARRMLEDGEKIDAIEAKRLGFVDVLVHDGDDLVAAACTFAEQWIAQGKSRITVEQGLVEELDQISLKESQQLADAIFLPEFLQANGMPWWIAVPLSPVLQLISKI
jgi:enoyl-CoA hydratase/carnithine racemase